MVDIESIGTGLALNFETGENTVMNVVSGNVGIGTADPEESAILDVNSNSKGFLLPRMNSDEISSITDPADGLQVYNTDDGNMYIYVAIVDVWKQLSYGAGTLIANCPPAFADSRDGHTYTAVKIGSQCWMAENLAYLPSVYPNDSGSFTLPYYYVYDYQGTDVSAAKATSNYQTYGVLYNWPAAMAGEASSNSVPSGVQGVCPSGWHLPSDEEWKVLEGEVDNQYGYPDPEWDLYEWRGSDAGGNLKETGTTHWNSPNTGATNSRGFTALPAGWRRNDGLFHGLGDYTLFWSSTESPTSSSSHACRRNLNYDNLEVYRINTFKVLGHSIRCIKD